MLRKSKFVSYSSSSSYYYLIGGFDAVNLRHDPQIKLGHKKFEVFGPCEPGESFDLTLADLCLACTCI